MKAVKAFALPALIAASVAGLVLAIVWWPGAESPGRPPLADAAAAVEAPRSVPSFDVVRVTRDGNAVIAGRAAPRAIVTILENGQPIGTVTADPSGEWVFVPERPLAAGSREISIVARLPGQEPQASEKVVVVAVPERPDDGALAVLTPRDGAGASRVLQGPAAAAMSGPTIDVVDYDDRGQVVLSGRAAPGGEVRLYLDGALIGVTRVGPDGTWKFRPERPIAAGEHELRIDQVGPEGRVQGRAAIPFTRVPMALVVQEGRVVVQPGNSLWQIARTTYGAGTRYTVIYDANRDRIRDPDLIYPGQVFALPKGN
jgi:nucleoid-associated protein YgaU